VTQLPPEHPLTQVLRPYLAAEGDAGPGPEVTLTRLKASRPVFRFTGPGGRAVVGKFFIGRAAQFSTDLALLAEYHHYRQAEAWGLQPGRHLPRLLGRRRHLRLGLIVDGVAGPDLDAFLARACRDGDLPELLDKLTLLARLLARFHTCAVPTRPVPMTPAHGYLLRLRRQLRALDLLTPDQDAALEEEARAWGERFARFPDAAVLLHGDATPTNFLFPNGRALAVDLERLRLGDRLFDLSWVAGEIRHAWGWRCGDLQGGEAAIGSFFREYLDALDQPADVGRRVLALNPFYMALAELRICRNAYLSLDYRRRLVAEALACLTGGRRMTA
jgi:hypothetical protein